MTDHYFAFSTNWSGQKRLCRECGEAYENGRHLTVDRLKAYTTYVCPAGDGRLGHSSTYTGANFRHPELRRPDEHLCICGAEFVEEDNETWLLAWELGPDWSPVSAIRSRHASHAQRDGLLKLIEQGEPIRNVTLTELKL